MRIGFDCRTILSSKGEKAGVGHYTYFLIKNLLEIDKDNQYILFFDQTIKEKEFYKKAEIVFFKKKIPFFSSHFFFSSFLKKKKLDLFHSPTHILPLLYNHKSIITIHDLAIYLHPEWFPKKQFFSTNILVPLSIKKAKKIIAVSENTKKDILNLFKVSSEKIKVIYPGSGLKETSLEEVNKIKEKYHLDKYILFLGTLEPRKNLFSLIKAFNLLENSSCQLVIAGKKGWNYENIFREIDRVNQKKERIKYLGYLPDQEKKSLFQGSLCFVFPSLYEGFGLPVLEAMSLGIPVITSRFSSLPEIIGKAGILINPYSIKEIYKALKNILEDNDLREELGKKSFEQSKKFNWKKTAEETLKLYQLFKK